MSTARSPMASTPLRTGRPEWVQAQQPPTRTATMVARPHPVPVTLPVRIPTQAAPRANRQTQYRILTLMVVAALCWVAAGLFYLSGPAGMAREAYRRNHLLTALHEEREKSKLYQQSKARLENIAEIERRAKLLGMVPAKEQQTYRIEAPHSEGQ